MRLNYLILLPETGIKTALFKTNQTDIFGGHLPPKARKSADETGGHHASLRHP